MWRQEFAFVCARKTTFFWIFLFLSTMTSTEERIKLAFLQIITLRNDPFRFKSDESLEATGFNCRIKGVKRNASLSTSPTSSPPTTTTTLAPLICPIPNQQYCSCGRVKSFGAYESDFDNFTLGVKFTNNLHEAFSYYKINFALHRVFVFLLFWKKGN